MKFAIPFLTAAFFVSTASAQLAILGDTVHTMEGPAITNGVVLIADGKITEVGSADAISIPEGYQERRVAVVTPGIIDAHATVGLSGILNYDHDQEQLEKSEPIQPELRAIDAYNPRDPLVTWVRDFGVTTVNKAISRSSNRMILTKRLIGTCAWKPLFPSLREKSLFSSMPIAIRIFKPPSA